MKNVMGILGLVAISVSVRFIRKSFIDETKKLSKKLGIPLWKIQFMIITGILVFIGGMWYVSNRSYSEGFKEGFSKGSSEGFKEGSSMSETAMKNEFKEGVKQGRWKAIKDISSFDPELLYQLDKLDIKVMDKYDNYNEFSKSYNREYWGFKGEWD